MQISVIWTVHLQVLIQQPFLRLLQSVLHRSVDFQLHLLVQAVVDDTRNKRTLLVDDDLTFDELSNRQHLMQSKAMSLQLLLQISDLIQLALHLLQHSGQDLFLPGPFFKFVRVREKVPLRLML